MSGVSDICSKALCSLLIVWCPVIGSGDVITCSRLNYKHASLVSGITSHMGVHIAHSHVMNGICVCHYPKNQTCYVYNFLGQLFMRGLHRALISSGILYLDGSNKSSSKGT